jgi:hypothetical protein
MIPIADFYTLLHKDHPVGFYLTFKFFYCIINILNFIFLTLNVVWENVCRMITCIGMNNEIF